MSLIIKREIRELKILLKSIPSPVVVMFAVSVIIMNLLANKSINLPVSWLALDCGITVSWVSFLAMDVITKHFGPKAATEVSLFAVIINLSVCLIFLIAGSIPGMWGEAYSGGSEEVINGALNRTFAGTWYVLFGSTIAFITSAVVNNFLNYAIGRLIKRNPDGFLSYAMRTYISTAAGQFSDNLVFALIVSHFFFGWTLTECVGCAFFGMIAELLFEIVFSPIGYRICRKWKADGTGREYFEFKKAISEEQK